MRARSQVVLPLDLEIKIKKDDKVFLMHEICEQLNYTALYKTYLRKWRKIDPSVIFELIVFGYMNGKYSSRDIEEVCYNDIRFMWILQGEPVPDHTTIARFQSKKLEDVMENLFYQFVEKLHEMGEVKFENIFVDGTKIEANANKYTFVWKKAVEKNLMKLNTKIELLIPILAERYGFEKYLTLSESYEYLKRKATAIELVFSSGKGKYKTRLQKDIELLGAYWEKKIEYEKKLGKMPNRNSYSKTDIDATFMRMKDDYMKNGQLKPGYNIQIGVESEYIVGVGTFTNPTDVQTLIPFLERIYSHTHRRFKKVIADAGYESIENYLYLYENKQKCFIKPTNYEIGKTRKYKSDKYFVEHLPYDKEKDEYICPRGDKLFLSGIGHRKTVNGYETKTKYYRNESCGNCPHFGRCHSSKKGFRTIKVTENFNDFRKETYENITSEEGILLRVNRSIQVEGAFGVLKQDYGFRRFLTRGKKNIETQFFLLAFAFNVNKLYNKKKSGRIGIDLFQLEAS